MHGFSRTHPHTAFVFRDYPIDEYTQKFHSGAFDICAEYIMDYYLEDPNVLFEKISETECNCAFPAEHRLYGRKTISAGDLHGEKMIIYNKGISRTADMFRFLCHEVPDIELLGIDSYDSNVYARCAVENAGLMMFFWV